jgi:uncharacterized protein
MKPRQPLHPERLDVAQFARDAATLDGTWPQAELPRVKDEGVPPDDAEEPLVRWAAQGREVQRPGEAPQVWLDLQAETEVRLTCQRCLAPVAARLEVKRSFLFVPGGEAKAAELDADSEEHDVLPLVRSFNLKELIEDELVMALPIVPRHEVCPEPLPMSAAQEPEEVEEAARPNPFAALEALKGKLGS